jgi:hypothetical protein
MHITIFSSLLANIFVSAELGGVDMVGRRQNLERQRVICKILLDKELDDAAALGFPVSGMDCSYCLGLNTM